MKENDQKCEPPRTQITDPTDQWCPQLGTWQNTVLQMFFLGVLLSACERCIQEQGRPRVLKQVCLGVARYRRAVFCIGDSFCNLPRRQFPWTRAAWCKEGVSHAKCEPRLRDFKNTIQPDAVATTKTVNIDLGRPTHYGPHCTVGSVMQGPPKRSSWKRP